MSMKFVKQSFMGIELDILIGHPEHDLLLIATQVAKDRRPQERKPCKYCYCRMPGQQRYAIGNVERPCGNNRGTSALAKGNVLDVTESAVYAMLLRGHVPASEPFRKWVTEEVLPVIRKDRLLQRQRK